MFSVKSKTSIFDGTFLTHLFIFIIFCIQTPFVRQNTPHPRELKAKAHKLFTKGQNSLEDSDLQSETTTITTTTTNTNPISSTTTTTATLTTAVTTTVEAINQHVKQQPQQQHLQQRTETDVNTQPPLIKHQVFIQPPDLPPEPIVGNGADESSEPSDDTDDVSFI